MKLTGFSTVASIVVVVINMSLAQAIRLLSAFEGHHTSELEDISITWRSFLSLFFNTAVLV